MGERAGYYPSLVQEPIYDQALSAIDRINDPRISKQWAREGYEIGELQLSDLLNPPSLVKRFNLFKVAIHERGHEAVARAFGWLIRKVSVVPDGNVLGVTVTSPGSAKPIDTLLAERIAIAAGGEAAEALNGEHDHSGAGSDRGSARFYARVLSKFTGESEFSILSRGMSVARMALGSLGNDILRFRAWSLTRQQVIA